MKLLIKKFPMSGSSNHQYMPSKGRLVKTPQSREYDQACLVWKLRNFRVIDDVDRFLKSMPEGTPIRLDAEFVFLHARLVGKKGQLKRIDCQNRLKSSIDNLMKIIGIDDSLIVESTCSKVSCESSRDEGVNFTISFTYLKFAIKHS